MKLKKSNKKSSVHENQKSFYFEDFMENNDNFRKLEKVNLIEDRIYILFFIFFSLILIFAISIFSTSVETPRSKFFKNETRLIEKNVSLLENKISILEKNLIEAHLEFNYLTSAENLSKTINNNIDSQYKHLESSQIYLSLKDFVNEQEKITKINNNETQKEQ